VFETESYTRLVLKIGSSLLVDPAGRLNQAWMHSLADDIAASSTAGREFVVVSSGAIALGRAELGLTADVRRLSEQQAAAAVGQIRLASGWHDTLAAHGLVTAQVLLTSNDTENRRRYLNAYDTLTTLISQKAVPVVNENDTVATDEIRYGDNDRLAARVAQMVCADALIIFSDVDGLYDGDPARADSKFVARVEDITPAVEAMASSARSRHGTGGMATKIAAARIAVAAGCNTFISAGHGQNPLRRLEEGGRCTRFVASSTPKLARKRWIAGSLRAVGRLQLDAGAVAALLDGKSLLPIGVTDIDGEFRRGDTVVLTDEQGDEVARGLSAYDSDEARKIQGRKTGEIANVLGYTGRGVLVHRNDLAFTRNVASRHIAQTKR